MITRIDVMITYVEDQDRVVSFFVDKLGFEKTTDGEMWPGARWIEVRPPGAQTSLMIGKASDFREELDKGYPGTFACEDLEATHARFAAAGVEVGEISNEPWGSYFQMSDPEGRTLMVNGRG